MYIKREAWLFGTLVSVQPVVFVTVADLGHKLRCLQCPNHLLRSDLLGVFLLPALSFIAALPELGRRRHRWCPWSCGRLCIAHLILAEEGYSPSVLPLWVRFTAAEVKAARLMRCVLASCLMPQKLCSKVLISR